MLRNISKIAAPVICFCCFGMAKADYTTFKNKLLNGDSIIHLDGDVLFSESLNAGDALSFNNNIAIVGNLYVLDGAGLYSGLIQQSYASYLARSISVGDDLTMQNFRGINGAAINSHDHNTSPVYLHIGNNTAFINNIATEKGGAVYVKGSADLITDGGTISFTQNYDSTGLNDIYLAANSTMTIGGSSGKIYIDSGIRSEDDTVTIIKQNSSKVIFGEDSQNSNYTGSFQHKAGVVEVKSGNFFQGENNVSGGAILHFFNDSYAGSMNMYSGAVLDLTPGNSLQFNTLTVNDYWASGASLLLHTDGVNSDVLKILNETYSGNTIVQMATNTSFTNNPNSSVLVVDADGAAVRNATFSLNGGTLDVGPLEWHLIRKADENWYLVNNSIQDGDSTGMLECDMMGQCRVIDIDGVPGSGGGQKISNTGRTVANLPAMHLSIVRAGMNELRTRLGDLRTDGGAARPGVWARGYAKHMNVDEHIHSTVNMLGTEAGLDFKIPIDTGRLYIGAMGGYLHSNDVTIHQTGAFRGSGNMQAPSAGLYATWLSKSGWFVDATLRHFWAQMSLRNIAANGLTVEYDADRNFYVASLEGGKQFYSIAPNWAQQKEGQSMFAWEPKAEVRFAHSDPSQHNTNFGDLISYGATNSFETRIALQTTYLPSGRDSVWRPFLELGLYNEWVGKTDIDFQGVQMNSDVSGFGIEFTAGLNVALSERSYLYGDVQYEYGKVFDAISGRLGIRYSFGSALAAAPNNEYDCTYLMKCYAAAPVQTVSASDYDSSRMQKPDDMIRIAGDLFATDSAKLSNQMKDYLADKAHKLKNMEYDRIAIVGHTDHTGGYAHNMDLSRRRAESVRDYLVTQGIPKDKIQVKGVGPNEPAIPKPRTKQELAENRRVEILVWK
jgi:outer membrane autotransporter protein